MKILAVRGKNLASLPAFEVDFEAGPLADAGLFAITGPTGAGKSTLLDALCLALYDRTPRLSSRRRAAAVGHPGQDLADRLGSFDPRLVLSHGTASGFAEVDFVGQDGERYRSKWEVHRARRKVKGRMQDQTLSLKSLDSGRALGGTKTETLLEIEARLGLSFDQFRRSVLLAQGDFAAFLRADKNERADLLERMTGTEIYGQISVAAYRRAAEEQAAVDELRTRSQSLSVLDEAERTKTIEAQVAAVSRRQACEQRGGEIEAASRYYRRAAELGAAAKSARLACEGARASWVAASARREELDLVRHAVPLRELVRRNEGRTRELDQRRTAAAESEVAVAAAAQEQARAEKERDAAERAGVALRARAAELKPVLELARGIESELKQAAERVAEADAKVELALAADTRGREQWDELEENRVALEDELADNRAWLQARAPLLPIADEWSLWRARLDEHQRFSSELVAVRAEHSSAGLRADAARARSLDSRGQVDEGKLAVQAAQAAAARGRELCAELPADEIRSEIDRHRAEQDRVREWRAMSAAAQSAAAAAESGQREFERAAARQSQARQRADDLTTEKRQVAGRYEEAEATLERLAKSLAGDVVALRSALVDGEECPVCGAEDHPYRDGHAPERGLLDSQRRRCKELRAQLVALDGQLAATAEELAGASKASQDAAATRTHALAELVRARQAWSARLSGELDGLEEVDAEQTARWLAEREALLCAKLEELHATEREARSRIVVLQGAEARVQARQSDLDHARAAATDTDAELGAAEQALALAAERVRSGAALLEKHDGLLEPLARSAMLLGLAGTGPELAPIIAAVQERARRNAVLDTDIAALRGRREELAAVRKRQVADLDAARQLAQQSASKADELRTRRLAVLGGRTSSEVADELEVAVEASVERLATANRACASAERQHSQAVERRRAIAADIERLATEAATVCERLSQASREIGVSEQRLVALAGRDDPWVAAEQSALEGLATAQASARAVVVERERAASEHMSTGKPSLLEEQLAGAREAAVLATKSARENEVALSARLAEDDRARQAFGELSAKVAEREARAAVYGAVKILIGSADGHLFRVFAQSLTLEALVAHANMHLGEFLDRYRLQRVPDHDLELQVLDRDMGDEVRSIQSLSGGESFLVSLALALGLSSLSAQDTRIESLLIDEGFGTLDPDTLDVALSVLDALQASGRKVGLISHVPGLAERVGVRIQVSPRGGGRSDVRVLG